jgi:DNA-binding MarR family transcriptional regulator
MALWRFSDELSASFEAFYAAHDLSRARGHVLVQLLDAPEGLTPAQLADRSGATPANMTGLLRSLQRVGLIRRERIAGDRRSQRIRLTPPDEGRWMPGLRSTPSRGWRHRDRRRTASAAARCHVHLVG